MVKLLIYAAIGLCLFPISGCQKQDKSKPEVVIWHWMSDRHHTFQQLAKRYQDETGTAIRFNLFPHSAYNQRINAAAAANDLPDLFGILGEKRVLASFAQENMIKNLNPYMEENNSEWKNRFIDITLAVNSFEPNNFYGVNPGIYGVPIDMMSIQFLYNQSLLKKAGYQEETPPETFEQFLQAAKKAAKLPGVYGFTSGWGETWMLECIATNYALNILGKDKFFATIEGKVPYNDPGWIEVFSIFEKLRKSEILAPDIVTLNNKEAEQMFATERAIFTFNGSWGVNTYHQINPDLSYLTIPPPRVSQDYNPGIWAGAGSSFVVNARSRNKKEAVAFLNWLTQDEQQVFLAKETNNLPAIKNLEVEISENLRVFSQNQEYYTHPRLWPRNENSRVIETINRKIQSILIGATTPEKAANTINDVKKRLSN